MMKSFKKVLFGGVALSAFTLAVVSPAFAAEDSDGNSTIKKSKGYVSLTANDGNGDGDNENNGGLKIEHVSNLLFGSHQLSSTAETYTVVTKENPYAAVSDLRGTGAGWTLQVSISNFIDEVNGRELKGATLTLPKGTAQAISENYSEAPLTFGNELNNELQQIMVASPDNDEVEYAMGMGTWQDVFDASEVELYVPAGNYAGDYTAELTWTLVDAE